MTLLEWPAHSGRIANYTDAELAFMNNFRRQHEAGEITKQEADRQMGHFHDLKVEFGLNIVNDVVEQDVQEPLPDPTEPRVGRFHKDGPVTERISAALVAPRSGTQRAHVLEHLRAVGERGATDYELWRDGNVGVRPHVAGTRREELISDGWPIIDTGRTRPTDTGTPAIVWVLVDKAESVQTEM